MRLNKYISHCGVCSRRNAAELVKSGKIKVNDEVEKNPAILVQEGDKVEYDGRILKLEEKLVYVLMNKPKGIVTTLSDEQGRRTVMDMIADKVQERIYPVGRLDMYTTGLLLLTNDGDLAHKLSHPSNNVTKVYQVTLQDPLDQRDFQKIKDGFDLEDGPFKIDKISILDDENLELGIEIHSGKNRIIRRIFEHLDHHVKVLDRVYYAGLTKKDLPRGWTRFLTEAEIIKLKHFNV